MLRASYAGCVYHIAPPRPISPQRPLIAAAPSRIAVSTAATVAPSSAYSPPPLLTPLCPRAAEALATADRLEGVGWVFAPAGRGSGVAVLFYPAALVDVESYAVLATHLADLGHAAVVLMATTEPAIQDPTGALARAAAGAARIKLGFPLAKAILAGNSMGGVAAMQALNA
jgi:hypothetical protein